MDWYQLADKLAFNRYYLSKKGIITTIILWGACRRTCVRNCWFLPQDDENKTLSMSGKLIFGGKAWGELLSFFWTSFMKIMDAIFTKGEVISGKSKWEWIWLVWPSVYRCLILFPWSGKKICFWDFRIEHQIHIKHQVWFFIYCNCSIYVLPSSALSPSANNELYSGTVWLDFLFLKTYMLL